MSFAKYKKSRKSLDDLVQKVDKMAKDRKGFDDDRFWKLTTDKGGNATVIMRFLPGHDNDDMPWVRYYDHNFNENGEYFVENCPTTLEKDCPICKANKPLWKAKEEGDRVAEKTVNERKRKLHFISNVLIIKDKENPENDGKVFLFKYGQKIFDKIKLKIKNEEDTPINIFDFWDGADFVLKVKKVDKFNNYDDSYFKAPSPLMKGENDALEAIYNQLQELHLFITEDKFKSYEELESKFEKLVSGGKAKVRKKAEDLHEEDSEETTKPKVKEKKSKEKEPEEDTAPWESVMTKGGGNKKKKKNEPPPEEEIEETENNENVEDEDLDYYNSFTE